MLRSLLLSNAVAHALPRPSYVHAVNGQQERCGLGPRSAQAASLAPKCAASQGDGASVRRYPSRCRIRNEPSRLGGSSPRPKPKLDRPPRSPLGSGATSDSFVERRSDCDAVVSGVVIACCCTPSASAVTIVTVPILCPRRGPGSGDPDCRSPRGGTRVFARDVTGAVVTVGP
jgi:hypothetical protein